MFHTILESGDKANNNRGIFKKIESNQINTNGSLAGLIPFERCKNIIESESQSKTYVFR
jgi:hypothetical protein